MTSKFELSLLESGDLIRRGKGYLLGNLGRVVAVLTAVIACLVTFTEIGFAEVRSEEFTARFLLTLTAACVIYFSMESAGEKSGEESEAYRGAAAEYEAVRAAVDADMLAPLSAFCLTYAAEELDFRRRAYLFARGVPPEGRDDRQARRALRRSKKMRAVGLSPAVLLASGPCRPKSELLDPGKTKSARLALRFLPTAVCMTVTVSVMLTAKDGLGAADIIAGIMRLSSLPVIAFKGYAEGYRYAAETLPLWVRTKTKLLRGFLRGVGKEIGGQEAAPAAGPESTVGRP